MLSISDKQFLVGDGRGNLKFIDIASGDVTQSCDFNDNDPITALCMSPYREGLMHNIIFGTEGGKIGCYSPDTNSIQWTKSVKKGINSVVELEDGMIVYAVSQGKKQHKIHAISRT